MKITFGKQRKYVDSRVCLFSLFGEGLKCNLAKHSRVYGIQDSVSNGSCFELKLYLAPENANQPLA